MAVNAAVLVVEALRSPEYRENPLWALGPQFSLLIATTATTVVGALPFIFNQTGAERIVRALAWVTILGVGSSFFFAILWIPALIHRFPRLLFSSKPKTGSAFAESKGAF
jgi:multidrug efflux pump subunit AcrB